MVKVKDFMVVMALVFIVFFAVPSHGAGNDAIFQERLEISQEYLDRFRQDSYVQASMPKQKEALDLIDKAKATGLSEEEHGELLNLVRANDYNSCWIIIPVVVDAGLLTDSKELEGAKYPALLFGIDTLAMAGVISVDEASELLLEAYQAIIKSEFLLPFITYEVYPTIHAAALPTLGKQPFEKTKPIFLTLMSDPYLDELMLRGAFEPGASVIISVVNTNYGEEAMVSLAVDFLTHLPSEYIVAPIQYSRELPNHGADYHLLVDMLLEQLATYGRTDVLTNVIETWDGLGWEDAKLTDLPLEKNLNLERRFDHLTANHEWMKQHLREIKEKMEKALAEAGGSDG